jgi:hypothetical protein
VWSYDSKPLHECTGHLNGRRIGAFVGFNLQTHLANYRVKVKVKVKQSRYRPGVAQRVPES